MAHLVDSRFSFSPEIYEGDPVKQKAYIEAEAAQLKARCAEEAIVEGDTDGVAIRCNRSRIQEMEAKIQLLKAELEEIPIKAEERRKVREEKLKEELEVLDLCTLRNDFVFILAQD